jgi:hypothetical protein
MAVTEENPNISSVFDGFIGLLPWQYYEDEKDSNFMYQLKNTGKIDHMIASFYITKSAGNSSSIKFGSYDEEGIAPGASLAMYRARGLDWQLSAKDLSVNGHDLSGGKMRVISFDMSLPYLYLPSQDFLKF